MKLKVDIPSIGRASDDVIFGAYVRVAEDDDGMNDIDWLMSQEVAEESPDVPIIDDLDDSGDDGPIERFGFSTRPGWSSWKTAAASS